MLNKIHKSRFVALLLVISILFTSLQSTVHAAIVSTSELVAEEQSYMDRKYLLKSLDREEVQATLVSQGVDLKMAKLRVASMTDTEVRTLNAKMDNLPAASGVAGTVVFILIVLLVTDLIGVTDVYPFIN